MREVGSLAAFSPSSLTLLEIRRRRGSGGGDRREQCCLQYFCRYCWHCIRICESGATAEWRQQWLRDMGNWRLYSRNTWLPLTHSGGWGFFSPYSRSPTICESCVALIRDFSLISIRNSCFFPLLWFPLQTMAKLSYYRWGIPDSYYPYIYNDVNILSEAVRKFSFSSLRILSFNFSTVKSFVSSLREEFFVICRANWCWSNMLSHDLYQCKLCDDILNISVVAFVCYLISAQDMRNDLCGWWWWRPSR